MGARKRAGRSEGSTNGGGLDENRNSVRLEGIGRRALEVIEDKLIPLVTGGLREQFLVFLDAGLADQNGIGIVNHIVPKAETFGGVIPDFRRWSSAMGAFGGPFLGVLALSKAFATFLKDGIVLSQIAEALFGFFGERFYCFHLARLANSELKNTLRPSEHLVNNVSFVEVIKSLFAREATLEWAIVFKRMKVRGDLAHAQGWPEAVTNPTFFGTDSDE